MFTRILTEVSSFIDVDPDGEILGDEGQQAVSNLAAGLYYIVLWVAFAGFLVSAATWLIRQNDARQAATARNATFITLAIASGLGAADRIFNWGLGLW